MKKTNHYYQGRPGDHFNGKAFFNPGGIAPRSLWHILKWKFTEKAARWPKDFPSPFADARPQAIVEGERIVITHIGHASHLIQTGGLNMVSDPWWSERASPFSRIGPKRVNPPGIKYENLPKIDLVLLTHNHYDHLDMATLQGLVKDHDPLVVTPLGNDAVIKARIGNARIETGDWGDCIDIPNGMKVHFEPCHHWSARGLRDRRMALWAAFVIENGARKIHHIGDTGYHQGINYRAAAEKHGSFDVSLLPIGAYEPRWFMEGQHQNPEEAVLGHISSNSVVSLGHHWGTVQLTNEAIEAPGEALAEARAKHGLKEHEFIAMLPGQVWDSDAA